MNDFEVYYNNHTAKQIRETEDRRIIDMLNDLSAYSKIQQHEKENPLKSIYLAVLKYGWKTIITEKSDRYVISLCSPRVPNTIIMVTLRPGKYKW